MQNNDENGNLNNPFSSNNLNGMNEDNNLFSANMDDPYSALNNDPLNNSNSVSFNNMFDENSVNNSYFDPNNTYNNIDQNMGQLPGFEDNNLNTYNPLPMDEKQIGGDDLNQIPLFNDNQGQMDNSSMFNNQMPMNNDQMFNNQIGMDNDPMFNNQMPMHDMNLDNNLNNYSQANEFGNEYDPMLNNQNYGQFDDQYNQFNNQNMQPDYNNFDNQQDFSNTASQIGDIEEAFIKEWLGKNYENVKAKKFDILALFLGPVALLFKKVTGLGFALLLIYLTLGSLSILLNNNLIVGIISVTLLILNILIAFISSSVLLKNIQKTYNKLKPSIQDENQLITIAKNNGGNSPLLLIIGIALMIIINMIAVILNINNQANARPISKPNSQNTIVAPVTQEADYIFKATYKLTYTTDIWNLDQNTGSLINGQYVFKYSNEDSENIKTLVNQDIKLPEGRNAVIEMFVPLFEGLAQRLGGTATRSTSPITNLTSDLHLTYFDVVANNSVTRYYLAFVPSEDKIIEFDLKSPKLTVDAQVHKATEQIIATLSKVNLNTNNANNSNQTITTDNANTTANNTVDNSINNAVNNGNIVINNQTTNQNTTANQNTTTNTANNGTVQNTTNNANNSNVTGVEYQNTTPAANQIRSNQGIDTIINQQV